METDFEQLFKDMAPILRKYQIPGAVLIVPSEIEHAMILTFNVTPEQVLTIGQSIVKNMAQPAYRGTLN